MVAREKTGLICRKGLQKGKAVSAIHAARSIGIISLGCAKNLVDSEIIAAHARSAGLEFASRPEKADIVIINTCAFIKAACDEARATIQEVCAWKKKGRCRAILVCGCLPQRFPDLVAQEYPEVDALLGLDAIPEAGLVLQQLAQGAHRLRHITRHARRLVEPPLHRPLFTGGVFAYLKIAEGCDNRCRYCTIPSIRGTYRSRPLAAILREAENLLEHGVREINLISQDTALYGHDLAGNGRLPHLLRALDKLGGRFWVRLLYCHPAHVGDDLLDAIAETSRVCRYLDTPIQHSHPQILAAMGRPLPAGGLEKFFERVRARVPDAALRTTCLVGFPGETDQHFEHLMQFTAGIGFDHLGVFRFSPEPGTPAAALPKQIAPQVAEKREQALMLQQKRIVAEKNRTRLGQTATLLVEGFAPRHTDVFCARAYNCAPEVDGIVYLKNAPKGCRPGTFIKARYTRVRGYDMEACP